MAAGRSLFALSLLLSLFSLSLAAKPADPPPAPTDPTSCQQGGQDCTLNQDCCGYMPIGGEPDRLCCMQIQPDNPDKPYKYKCKQRRLAGSDKFIKCGGSINGDPEVIGYDGRAFLFEGVPGRFYNILSEKEHSLTGKLTFAHMWDHNGTYFTTIGLKYLDLTVSVHTVFDGSLEVEVHGDPLVMEADSWTKDAEYQPAGASVDEKLKLKWQIYRPGYGHAVELNTPMLNLLIWSAPPGPDAGGVMQPAYLNFQSALHLEPKGTLHGFLGTTYVSPFADLEASANGNVTADAGPFPGSAADYEVEHLFSHSWTWNQFSPLRSAAARRSLKNAAPRIVFDKPLMATVTTNSR